MRRVLLVVALAAGAYLGVDAMADATQNRPDAVVEGSTTTVDFTVSTRRYPHGDAAAAAALWAVCAGTVDGEVSPVPEPHDGGWRVTVSPAIGHHGEARLVGCLQDLTLDRVRGDVTRLQ